MPTASRAAVTTLAVGLQWERRSGEQQLGFAFLPSLLGACAEGGLVFPFLPMGNLH